MQYAALLSQREVRAKFQGEELSYADSDCQPQSALPYKEWKHHPFIQPD